MKYLRFSWRACSLIIWVLVGLVTLLVVFPWSAPARQQAIIQRWSYYLLRFSGVKVVVQHNGALQQESMLMVANHVSWLDIFVINSQRATAFVAKEEIRRWPVIGLLVSWAGTVFIDRSQRHAIKHVMHQLESKLQHQQAVGLFPEGKTSAGLAVQPFHSSLFETALRAQMAVQPVALRYYQGAERCPEIAFVGEQTLVQNAWQLLSRSHIRIECDFLPVLSPEENAQRGRAQTAQLAQQRIAAAVSEGL